MTLTKFVLFAWTPLVLILFARLPRRRALLLGVIAGTLFLPEVQIAKVAPEAPDASEFVILILKFTKPNAISFSALLGAFLFDRRRVLGFRPRWFDVPMMVWCVCPYFSDRGIGISFYDSFTAVRDQTLIWGVPYFLGRIYFTDFDSFRELAIGLVLGGLAYVPFALYEIRVSPRLHEDIYGFFPGAKDEFDRMGGFRPVVFLSHGLAVGIWLVLTAVTAFWLWWSGVVRRILIWPFKRPMPMFVPALVLLTTSALSRSTGAIGIGLAGVLAGLQLRFFKVPIIFLLLLLVSPVYLVARTAGGWTADEFVTWVRTNIDEDRANSFLFRVNQENRLIRKVEGSPVFGYGDTGEARKVEKVKKDDEPEAVTDSLWIICLSCYGYFGLIAAWTAMLLPAARFMLVHAPRTWFTRELAPASAGATIVILHMLDNISNAMTNPVLILVVGAVAGVTGAPVTQTRELPDPPQLDRPPAEDKPRPRRPGVLVRGRRGR